MRVKPRSSRSTSTLTQADIVLDVVVRLTRRAVSLRENSSEMQPDPFGLWGLVGHVFLPDVSSLYVQVKARRACPGCVPEHMDQSCKRSHVWESTSTRPRNAGRCGRAHDRVTAQKGVTRLVRSGMGGARSQSSRMTRSFVSALRSVIAQDGGPFVVMVVVLVVLTPYHAERHVIPGSLRLLRNIHAVSENAAPLQLPEEGELGHVAGVKGGQERLQVSGVAHRHAEVLVDHERAARVLAESSYSAMKPNACSNASCNPSANACRSLMASAAFRAEAVAIIFPVFGTRSVVGPAGRYGALVR
jgi:hypothetical protein